MGFRSRVRRAVGGAGGGLGAGDGAHTAGAQGGGTVGTAVMRPVLGRQGGPTQGVVGQAEDGAAAGLVLRPPLPLLAGGHGLSPLLCAHPLGLSQATSLLHPPCPNAPPLLL